MVRKILDLQHGSVQQGRLRIGQKITTKNGRLAPTAIDAWRITTHSRMNAEVIAELHGGTARPWEGYPGQWEIFTDTDVLWGMIPAQHEMLSQSYEMWNDGGCVRRCDGVTAKIAGDLTPCQCPFTTDPDGNRIPDTVKRAAMAARGEACKPTTRLSIRLPDVPTAGVFRLDTHSWYAAREMADVAEFIEQARDLAGVMLPITLSITHREQRTPGQPVKKFSVPVLDIAVPPRELMSGNLTTADVMRILPPPERLAITAGPAARPAAAPTIPVADPRVQRPPAPEAHYSDADAIVAAAKKQARWREDIVALEAYARERLWTDHQVRTDDLGPDASAHGEVWEDLGYYLQRRWKELRHRPPATRPLVDDVPLPEPPPED